MADLVKPLAPSSFAVDFDGKGELDFKSCKVPQYKPKLAGESARIGSTKDGKAIRQINSAGFEEESQFDVVCISSQTSSSASVVMWKWFKDCLPTSEGGNGKWAQNKVTGSIYAYDTDSKLVAQWDFKEAWPCKFSLAECSVTDNKYLEETWTIQTENCVRVL
jgi:phage tail-like protein